MNANIDLLFKDEVYQIVGCAIEVLNGIRHGLHERPYENSLVVELRLRGIAYVQQPHYPILYKGIHVGEYMPDLIAFNALIIDTKVVDNITDHEGGQTPPNREAVHHAAPVEESRLYPAAGPAARTTETSPLW